MVRTVGRDEHLPWGRHKGEAIEDVDLEYLKSVAWVISNEDSEFWTASKHRGYVTAMLDEIEHRDPSQANLVRDAKLALEAADKLSPPGLPVYDSTVDIGEVGAIAADLALGGTKDESPPLPAHIEWVLPLEAIDTFSKNTELLKMFVQRVNKDHGLSQWILATAQEAFKNGVVVDVTESDGIAVEVARYAGLRVVVRPQGNTRTILSLTKTPG